MTKRFKKVIALVLSVLMLVSAMPFTAMTAMADEITLEDANAITAETFNAKAYHMNAEAVQAYSNVVWQANDSTAWDTTAASDNCSTASDGFTNVDGLLVKAVLPKNIVLAYDGVNTAKQPVLLEVRPTSKNGHIIVCYPVNNGTVDDNSVLKNVGIASDDLTPAGAYWRGSGIDYTKWLEYSDQNIGYARWKDTDHTQEKYQWNFNENISKFWYNSMAYQGTGNTEAYYEKVSNLQFNIYSTSQNSWNKGYADRLIQSSGNTYVLNYKPLYDIINSEAFTAKNNEVFGENNYTTASINAYKAAVLAIKNVNVNAIFADANEFNVESKVQDAAKAIKNAVNGYNTAVAGLTVCNHTNTEIRDFVANTAIKDGYSGDTYCVDCGKKQNTGETIKANGDFTNYDAIIGQVNALEREKYTTTSLDALNSAVDTYKNIKTTANTQDDIDDAVTAIQTALNGLVLNDVTVTFSVVENGVEKTIETTSVKVGGVYTANYESKNIYKWIVGTSNGDSMIGSSEKEVSAVINENTTITAYIQDDASSAESLIKVVYIGYHGKVAAIDYVNSDEEIDKTGRYAQKLPFYSFNGWTQIETTNVVTMYPEYSAENSCEVTFNEVDINSYYGYDEEIKFPKNDYLALNITARVNGETVKYNVKNTGFIHVPHATSISIEYTNDVENNSAIIGAFVSTDETDTPVANINAVYNVEDEDEVAYAGVIFTTDSTTDLVIMGKNVRGVKASSVSAVNEYTIALHSTFDGAETVYARSFVRYLNGYVVYGNIVSLNVG